MQNQMEEEDTEGESDADDSDESDDGEEVPIPGRWNWNFSSALTINDGLDSNWEYHQNNVAVGAMFPSKRHMQDAIIKWAMASQRQLRTTVSSGKYLTMECVDINCPGRVHGYVPMYETTWHVSDFVAHSCELSSIHNDHCNMSSNLIARLLYTEIVEGHAIAGVLVEASRGEATRDLIGYHVQPYFRRRSSPPPSTAALHTTHSTTSSHADADTQTTTS
ncbi:hypothetical protein QYE76_034251 [Lolium multiflorum]|uniref:Transposase MuDR plant domain-containing protein n=1 Tax=Lolium multiflorum TaxID=4521 RepID=A0AAD8VN44_LOLMU|nr:hypothetical protein QYE76_034251 [Lolium multiflorum]